MSNFQTNLVGIWLHLGCAFWQNVWHETEMIVYEEAQSEPPKHITFPDKRSFIDHLILGNLLCAGLNFEQTMSV